MTVTYVVKDLAEVAQEFRKKEAHLQNIGTGVKGHWPARDKKIFLIQAGIWGQAAVMLENTRIEAEAAGPGIAPGTEQSKDLMARWAKERDNEQR